MTEPAEAKEIAKAWWAACDTADAAALGALVGDDLLWEGPWPAKEARSAAEVIDLWAIPMRATFPQVDRQFHILTAGVSDAREDGSTDGAIWAAGAGYLVGTPVAEMLGIPAVDKELRLRWGEFLRIEDGKVVEVQMLVDMIDWFEKIGRPVLQPKGVAGVWPSATAFDGADLGSASKGETYETLRFGRAFIYGALNVFDKEDLSSMGMANFFHPNVKWYGPGGIGACLSLQEFEDNHQRPWLEAFPDRKLYDLRSLFAEGRMLSASGARNVVATHTGPYQGVAASENRLELSGLDFWLRTDEQFTENWVFVDMIKLFSQMGVDLMARMKDAE